MLTKFLLYDFYANLNKGRWYVMSLVMTVICFIITSDIIFYNSLKNAQTVNVWDIGLCILFNPYFPSWIFLVGLTLVAGDMIALGQKNGTLQFELLYCKSRFQLLLAKQLSLGLSSIVYMSVFLLCCLIAAMVHSVPFSIHNSLAANNSMGASRFTYWYPLPHGWSTMLYFLTVVYYNSFTLWVSMSIISAMSLITYPSSMITYAATVIWVIMSPSFAPANSLLDIRVFLSAGKHISLFLNPPMPVADFFLVCIIILIMSTVIGSFRLKKIEF